MWCVKEGWCIQHPVLWLACVGACWGSTDVPQWVSVASLGPLHIVCVKDRTLHRTETRACVFFWVLRQQFFPPTLPSYTCILPQGGRMALQGTCSAVGHCAARGHQPGWGWSACADWLAGPLHNFPLLCWLLLV
jgi:hypothetical protein